MNAQTPSSSPVTAAPTLTPELVSRFAVAFGDTDAALVRRATALHAALKFGADVKSICRDMADANRADASIPTVAASTLGYARAAINVSEMVGSDLTVWAKRESKMVADSIRAAKRVGVKTLTVALREALHGIDGPVAREEIAGEVITRQLATILPAATAQGPRSAAGESTAPADTDATNDVHSVVTGVHIGSDAADALATVRALTGWFQRGGTWSPDLASALAELASAATSARKRTVAPATVAPLTATPVAA